MKLGDLLFARFRGVIAISILLLGFSYLNSSPVYSQGSEGRILGTVTDQSGGAVAGATVTITDTERGTNRTLTTDDSGEYNAPSLIPGTYKVHVEAKGFKAIDRTNVTLEVNGSDRVDLQLQAGDVSQTITVSEDVPLVETTNAELGGTLEKAIIENLPLNGRNFENLLALRPGVSIYVGGGGWTQSTNGVRPHDNTYLVEGVNSNDPWMAQSIMNAGMAAGDAGTILPVDAIQEFKTEVNPAAQYGWKPGAVVSIGIKSGTNGLHGSAYAYGRSDSFDARNYFNPDVNSNPSCTSDPTPCDKTGVALEQFGATLGGPIVKDKLFFFTTFEEQRYTVGSPTEHSVETPTILENQCLAAGSGVTALSLQLVGATSCANLATEVPKNNFDGIFPVTSSGSLLTDLNSNNLIASGLVKADYHLNDKNSISGMYFISPGSGTFVDNAPREVNSAWLTDQYARSQVGSGNWTWTPNSTWVNEARVGYSHYYQTFHSTDSADNPADYSFNGSTYNIYTGQTNPDYFGLPRIRISGPASIGGTTGFQLGLQWPKSVGPDAVLQLLDEVSYLHGKHAFKWGFEFLRDTSDNNVTANVKGPVQFHGLQNFFEGIGQASTNTGFLTGNLARDMSYEGYGLFFQDDWRLTPRVTVNLGLRYELTTVFKESNNLVGNFDPSSPTGLEQVGDGISSPFAGNHHNFSPRLGVAWDVFGDGKTVVRGGASLIYEQLSLDALNGQANFLGLRMVPTGAQLFSTGNGTTFTQGSGTINVVDTPGLSGPQAQANWALNSASNPLYSQTAQCGTGLVVNPATPDPPPCDIFGVDPHLKSPYVTTWTLGIQRQLMSNMSLEVAYVGNHATKLLGVVNINQPAVGSGFTPAALTACAADPTTCGADPNLERENQTFTKSCPTTNGVGLGIGNSPCFPYLNFVEMMSNIDESNYNGMQVTLTQRPVHGLSFTAAYTYSHALDDSGDNEGNGLHTPQVASNPFAMYGNSDFDIRHRFTLSATYTIPGKKGFGQMLEGWTLNAIVTLESGSPWGVNDQTSDLTGTGENANPLGDIGEPWYFFGNKSDFTPVHGWSDTNGGWQSGGGGVPYFGGTSNATCLAKASALGQLAVASLTNTGCYAVGNSVLIPGPYGSAGPTLRNVFRDDGFKNLDMSVAKAFKFHERLSAEFKAEIFNLFNTPWFANPYGGPGGQAVDPTAQPFGFVGLTPDTQASNPVLGSGGARAIQLGLKLTF